MVACAAASAGVVVAAVASAGLQGALRGGSGGSRGVCGSWSSSSSSSSGACEAWFGWRGNGMFRGDLVASWGALRLPRKFGMQTSDLGCSRLQQRAGVARAGAEAGEKRAPAGWELNIWVSRVAIGLPCGLDLLMFWPLFAMTELGARRNHLLV